MSLTLAATISPTLAGHCEQRQCPGCNKNGCVGIVIHNDAGGEDGDKRGAAIAEAGEAVDAARRDWPRTQFSVYLDGGVIEGSADRLRVAFKNLLDNAAKFGPPDGRVEVRLTGGALIVRDHGPGIADADLPFVFDRFYRALSSRSAPGSGLGLAVVSEIVTGHGGTITAEQAPGGGTIMRLTLPDEPFSS